MNVPVLLHSCLWQLYISGSKWMQFIQYAYFNLLNSKFVCCDKSHSMTVPFCCLLPVVTLWSSLWPLVALLNCKGLRPWYHMCWYFIWWYSLCQSPKRVNILFSSTQNLQICTVYWFSVPGIMMYAKDSIRVLVWALTQKRVRFWKYFFQRRTLWPNVISTQNPER